jgi:hypothetical protein
VVENNQQAIPLIESFTEIESSFDIPSFTNTIGNTDKASIWVGIDGYGQQDLFQTGIDVQSDSASDDLLAGHWYA